MTPAEVEAEESGKDAELDGFDVVIECSGFPPAIEKVTNFQKKSRIITLFYNSPFLQNSKSSLKVVIIGP